MAAPSTATTQLSTLPQKVTLSCLIHCHRIQPCSWSCVKTLRRFGCESLIGSQSMEGWLFSMRIPITCRSVGSRLAQTEYPAALYREFLCYVKTKYADQYWHALPKEVARHTSTKFVPPNDSPRIRRACSAEKSPAYAADALQSCSSRIILRILGPEERPKHWQPEGSISI